MRVPERKRERSGSKRREIDRKNSLQGRRQKRRGRRMNKRGGPRANTRV